MAEGFSHWLAPFVRAHRGRMQAFCGTWIDPKQHATEPTCPVCVRLLQEDDAGCEGLLEQLNDPDRVPVPLPGERQGLR